PYAHGSDNARERSSESPPESPPESSPKSPPESSPNGYYGYAGYPTHARPRDSLDLIKREKWIILLSIVATTAIALAYNSTLEAEYESSALLMIYPDKQMSGQIDLSSGGLLSRGEHSMSNELIVLRSSLPIARKVASRLLDMEQRDELTVVHDGNGNTLGVAEIAKRLQWGYIRVQSEGRDADVVRVTAISSAAAEAAILANLYSEEYVNLTQEASRASLTASRKYLEDQLAVRREQLRVIENETQAYMTRTGAISLDSEGERLVKQIGELETLRDEARVDLQMREASLRERERELEELYPQLSRGISSALGAEITKAQENLVELELARNRLVLARDGLTDAADGKLSDLDGEIDARRRQLEALSTQYVDEVMAGGGIDLLSGPEGRRHITDLNRQIVNDRVATTGLQAKIQVVEARLREQESKLQELPEQSIKLAQLQRDRLSAERMYAAVVERLQELRIAEESKLGYATIIREALAPSAPARPNKRKNIALGLLAGIALGLAGATARRRRDTCLYSLDDARRATGNVIGAIPDMH
ncbi:MAG: GNVR domain-containing protein, partial [Rhodothermales bacterium]